MYVQTSTQTTLVIGFPFSISKGGIYRYDSVLLRSHKQSKSFIVDAEERISVHYVNVLGCILVNIE